MEILTNFTTLDEECSYLSDRNQRIEYIYIDECSSEYQNRLVKRGWRRFGQLFLRPNCHECNECKSIKIDVENYKFSKSQRRIMRKNQDLQIIIQTPTLTDRHVEIYNKFHAHQKIQKDWKQREISMEEFFDSFVDGAEDFGREILYYDGDTLIAVDFIDMVDDGISSIYFIYDPDYFKRSLGTYSLLIQIRMAQNMNLDWIYLGYYVKDCKNLNYKDRFAPLLTMQGEPTMDEEDVWK